MNVSKDCIPMAWKKVTRSDTGTQSIWMYAEHLWNTFNIFQIEMWCFGYLWIFVKSVWNLGESSPREHFFILCFNVSQYFNVFHRFSSFCVQKSFVSVPVHARYPRPHLQICLVWTWWHDIWSCNTRHTSHIAASAASAALQFRVWIDLCSRSFQLSFHS